MRIRISGECKHEPIEFLDGEIGTVTNVLNPDVPYYYKDAKIGSPQYGILIPGGHRFVVVPDRAMVEYSPNAHIWLAAIELEPLDA